MVAELSSDSEVEDEDQYGVQDKEISSNECALGYTRMICQVLGS